MKKRKFTLILMVIMLLGAILRITRLETIPPHLGNDEISIAYDSYSIRKIGKDEHGHSWPLSFESHRTYKAPLYAYLNIPMNWIFGNNEYGVRMLSAIFGVLAIYLSAILGKYLLGEKLALMSALLMAINPKAIFASRIAFESNIAFVIMSLGVLSMFYFRDKERKLYLILAGFFLGLSIWAYHTQWGLVPILAVVLPLLEKKENTFKKWWPMWLMIILVALPIFVDFINVRNKDSNNRASSQLWLSAGQTKDYLNWSQDGKIKKTLNVAMTPVNNYLEHFSLDTLFSSGSDLFNGNSPMESGWFLLATMPLLFVALFNFKKIFKKNSSWILGWWLLCPVVPAMTYGGVSSVRNLAFLMPTILIVTGGFKIIWNWSKKIGKLLVILIAANFFVFGISYFIHFPVVSGDSFQYGYKEAWEFIKPNIDRYDQVVVESRFGEFGQYSGVPHLYFGYFGAFRPEEMQKRTENGGTRIGKYEFRYVDWNREDFRPKTLYIVSAINPKIYTMAEKVKEIGMIRNTNFKIQFYVYETVDK